MNGSHHTLQVSAGEQARQISATQARKLIEANELYLHSNQADIPAKERSYTRLAAKLLVVEVLADSPQSAEALNLLGRIELDLNHAQEAIVCFDTAIALAPLNSQYHTNRGYAAIAEQALDEAISHFERGLRCDRTNANAFAGIAIALQRQGNALGAFLRFKSLFDKGIRTRLVQTGLSECCAHLQVDTYDSQLEALALDLLGSPFVEKEQLDVFISSLLVAKYDLTNDAAPIDLAQLAQDTLLLAALHHTRLSNLYVENLLTLVRQVIFMESVEAQRLNEDYHSLVVALGAYASRIDYAFAEAEDETAAINRLLLEMAEHCRQRWTIEDVTGALMLTGMYRSLYQQSFSFSLLRQDLADWPAGIQALLQTSLYEQADEHSFEYQLPANPEALYQEIEHVRPYPRWNQLGWESEADYLQLIKTELKLEKLPEGFTNKRLEFLIVDCGTGRRALRIAKYFSNVEVLAIDSRRENIAYAIKKAKELNITNIQFMVAKPEEITAINKRFDVIECNSGLANYHSADSIIGTLTQLMHDEGILRLGLYRQAARQEVQLVRQVIEDKGILAATDNIRALRRAIVDDHASGQWERILATPDFYSLNGTRALLFGQHEHAFTLKGVQELLGEQRLSFLGFAGIARHAAEQLPRLSKQNLAAWHELEQKDPELFADAYFFFSRKIQK